MIGWRVRLRPIPRLMSSSGAWRTSSRLLWMSALGRKADLDSVDPLSACNSSTDVLTSTRDRPPPPATPSGSHRGLGEAQCRQRAIGIATHVCLVGKSGHPRSAHQCPLMTQSLRQLPSRVSVHRIRQCGN